MLKTKAVVILLIVLAAIVGKYTPELQQMTCSANAFNAGVLLLVCLALLFWAGTPRTRR